MKKITFLLTSLFLAVMVLSGCTTEETYGSGANPPNRFNEPINSATSTGNVHPSLVLDTNTARQYAIITNDSDTPMYLHFGNFDNPSLASTTVLLNEGILLSASGTAGSFYEITPENLYYGQVWVTSTVAAKVITTIEK